VNEMSKKSNEKNISKDKTAKCLISPKRFVYFVQKVASMKNHDCFQSHEQNDFAEFLYFLIDGFHTILSKPVHINIQGKSKTSQDEIAKSCFQYLKQRYKSEYSPLFPTFFGITVSEIIHVHDPSVKLSIRPEHFFMLDLEIPQTREEVSLYQCLDRFVENEWMTGENAWYNEITKQKETVIKKVSFWNFPPILIICLKRFHGQDKNNTMVRFPLTDLNLTKYVCGYDPQKYQYDLYATCNHFGTSQYGHYIANIFHDNTWYCYNDDEVTPINTKEHIALGAYCLFYRIKVS